MLLQAKGLLWALLRQPRSAVQPRQLDAPSIRKCGAKCRPQGEQTALSSRVWGALTLWPAASSPTGILQSIHHWAALNGLLGCPQGPHAASCRTAATCVTTRRRCSPSLSLMNSARPPLTITSPRAWRHAPAAGS